MMLLRQLKRTDNTSCSQYMTLYRVYDLGESKSTSSNMHDIDGIEQEEVVMSLTRRGWTWPTVSSKAIAVCSLGKGLIPFQFARTGRDIVDNPNNSCVYREPHTCRATLATSSSL